MLSNAESYKKLKENTARDIAFLDFLNNYSYIELEAFIIPLRLNSVE